MYAVTCMRIYSGSDARFLHTSSQLQHVLSQQISGCVGILYSNRTAFLYCYNEVCHHARVSVMFLVSPKWKRREPFHSWHFASQCSLSRWRGDRIRTLVTSEISPCSPSPISLIPSHIYHHHISFNLFPVPLLQNKPLGYPTHSKQVWSPISPTITPLLHTTCRVQIHYCYTMPYHSFLKIGDNLPKTLVRNWHLWDLQLFTNCSSRNYSRHWSKIDLPLAQWAMALVYLIESNSTFRFTGSPTL